VATNTITETERRRYYFLLPAYDDDDDDGVLLAGRVLFFETEWRYGCSRGGSTRIVSFYSTDRQTVLRSTTVGGRAPPRFPVSSVITRPSNAHAFRYRFPYAVATLRVPFAQCSLLFFCLFSILFIPLFPSKVTSIFFYRSCTSFLSSNDQCFLPSLSFSPPHLPRHLYRRSVVFITRLARRFAGTAISVASQSVNRGEHDVPVS